MRSTAALAILTFAAFTRVLTAQQEALAGHWEGAIVLTPAEEEVDIVVDFKSAGERIEGRLKFPVTLDGAHEVESLSVQGSMVAFSVRDRAGVVSAFKGTLSADGASMEGTMLESGKNIPFTLRRVTAPGPAPKVPTYRLTGDGTALTQAFDGDLGKVRILLLLNPMSFASKVTMRIVERFVMDQIDDQNLRVYVVWKVPDKPRSAEIVRIVAGLAPDPRITHFWSTDPSLAKLFEAMLAFHQPISNPCMLFGPERHWTTPAPLPDLVRQSPNPGEKNPSSTVPRFNGSELAADVRRLLATGKGPAGSDASGAAKGNTGGKTSAHALRSETFRPGWLSLSADGTQPQPKPR